jgi:homoserine/homoserine lactone efflux protein
MITLSVLLAFMAASAALIAIPGPNVAVIVATGAAHGTRSAMAVVAGTTLAQMVQIGLVVVGLTALLETFSWAFALIKWAGIAYLVWLGVSSLRARVSTKEAAPMAGKLFLRGAATALANPKTMVFHAAFLPLFVNPELASGPQLFVLASVFIVIALILDSAYALGAGALSAVFTGDRFRKYTAKLSGSVMLAAAGWLAIRREA